MQIKQHIKKTFLVIVASCAVSSLTAMEPEFEKANLTTARLKGSEYKRQAASALPALLGTDTLLLVEGITDGNNDKYVALAKNGIKAIVGPWIDGLLVADIKFVVTGVTVASLSIAGRAAAANRLRSVFKAKLLDVIEKAAIAVPVATSGNHKALKIVRNAVNQAVADEVKVWLTTLGGATIADGDNLLDKAIAAGAVNPPLNQTKGAFKTAIENLIKTF